MYVSCKTEVETEALLTGAFEIDLNLSLANSSQTFRDPVFEICLIPLVRSSDTQFELLNTASVKL
jgi:hypothetical protein